ncbi:MAG: ECF transporter S component [Candidatus Ancillula sp.]|nr:ECF transporter S component [Candidatus Ancillula sp.]
MNTTRIVQIAAFIGFTVSSSLMVIIPIPGTGGIFTPIEVGIFVAASLFGAKEGALIGALSGVLVDLLSGFPQWAPFSLTIYAVVGAIVGFVANKRKSWAYIVLAFTLGGLIMVALYFLVTVWIYGFAAALASIIPNIVQSGFGGVGGGLLLKVWQTATTRKALSNS